MSFYCTRLRVSISNAVGSSPDLTNALFIAEPIVFSGEVASYLQRMGEY